MWNRIERRGKVDEAKGKVKQAVGALTGNGALTTEGRVDEAAGKMEAAVGRTRRMRDAGVAKVAKR